MDLKDEFRVVKGLYNDDKFEELIDHKYGIYFLKLRSLSRAEILRQIGTDILGIDCSGKKSIGDELFEFIFCQDINEEDIDKFIEAKYIEENKNIVENEDYLYSQLYKLKSFSWGGFYQNAVEKDLVNNFIKKIQDFEEICLSIENDITPRVREYVLASWYNHWSSILIEAMINAHPDVLPAVGRVKKVDFFWKNFPFDLKVTYFPNGFLQEKRISMGLKNEFVALKKFARDNDFDYDRNGNDRDVFSELYAKISEDISKNAIKFIKEFDDIRKEIISETIKNPDTLIRWLYENQGERRFDASNRFFLILIDIENFEDSWKLKRNKKLLSLRINEYLNENKDIDFEKLKTSFIWMGNEYKTYATTLFILKE